MVKYLYTILNVYIQIAKSLFKLFTKLNLDCFYMETLMLKKLDIPFTAGTNLPNLPDIILS